MGARVDFEPLYAYFGFMHELFVEPHKTYPVDLGELKVVVRPLKSLDVHRCMPLLVRIGEMLSQEEPTMIAFGLVMDRLPECALLIAYTTDIAPPPLDQYPHLADENEAVRTSRKVMDFNIDALGELIKKIIEVNAYFFGCALKRAAQEVADAAAVKSMQWEHFNNLSEE